MKAALGLALFLGIAAPGAYAGRPVLVKIGTVAPQDSVWHTMFRKMGQDWARISNGTVKLRIYAGGVLGDEPDLVRKMRIGQLHAVGLSAAGIFSIDRSVMALQIPLLIDSYAELDFIRDRMSPKLEKIIEKKGYVVLNWSDAGWVHFFAKQPAPTPDKMRARKLFVWAGDANAVKLFKSAGFRPVPLQVTDMLSALQTGLIDAFPSPPLVALVNQWFAPPMSGNMLDLKWAALIGCTLISKRTWQRIPADLRPRLREAAHQAAADFQRKIRRMSAEAVRAMEKRGLNVIRLDAATQRLWDEEVEKVYPQLRGGMIPADFFDEAVRLHREFVALRGKSH